MSEKHWGNWTTVPSGELSELRRKANERDNWEETAAQHCRNEQFWRGLVYQIGELFGDDAKRCDDGSLSEDILGLKVPELVTAQQRKIQESEARVQGLIELEEALESERAARKSAESEVQRLREALRELYLVHNELVEEKDCVCGSNDEYEHNQFCLRVNRAAQKAHAALEPDKATSGG